MCFGGARRDPKIEEEQAKARAEAEAAKEAALAAKEAQRQKLLAQEKEKATSAMVSGRQSEMGRTVSGELTNTGLARKKRGGRGRGSLMTSTGAGIGYYNENM